MEQIDFMKAVKMCFNELPNKVFFKVADAEDVLERALKWRFGLTGETYVYNPVYKEVADWLSDNKGKGLFMFGHCGQGKTILAHYILPAIFSYYVKPSKVMNYYPMVEANTKVDEVLKHHIICLDDVGVEEQYVEYGFKRNSFSEIMDAVEQKGKLVVITTNLSPEEIEARYGTRTIERIIATCRPICFNMCENYAQCKRDKMKEPTECENCNRFKPNSFRK